MTKIAIIVGSTREGRVTDKLAAWVANEGAKVAEVELLDLRDYELPFFNEQIPPRYNSNRQSTPEVHKWIEKVAEFDGYVIVTPEYNRSIPGVLKNALDTLGNEIADKPVAIVGHGSSGAAQAVASLRITLPGNGAVTLPTPLFFADQVGVNITDDGVLNSELDDGHGANLNSLLATLVKYSDALQAVRA